ncbi:MAG: DUF115 domain-containing protein, partial [Spirochaetota bacterium]|nr:DUF115 domain-containing protein [Spirochaetota bacterium]
MGQISLSHNINIINDSSNNDSLKEMQSSVLEPFLSRSGQPSLKYKDTLIHSGYDPIKEARKLIHLENPDISSLIFVIGLGYGYHIRELLQQLGDRKAQVFIFEWDQNIFTSALHHADLGFLRDKRLRLFVGNDFWQSFQQIISSIETSSIRGGCVLRLKSEYLLFQDEYDGLMRKVNEMIQHEFQNRLTSLEFEKLWIRNLFQNSRHLFQHHDISKLFKRFQGQTALIASAGPSLSLSLPDIKKYKEKIFLIATDTALASLLQVDIIPDFVVSLDSQIHNYRDFWTSPASLDTTLLFDLTVFPAIPKSFGRQKYYFSSTHRSGGPHPFVDSLKSLLNIDITTIAGGGSVATAAIELSRLLGFEHIILTGQDLSYSSLASHCSGTPHYDLSLMSSNRR